MLGLKSPSSEVASEALPGAGVQYCLGCRVLPSLLSHLGFDGFGFTKLYRMLVS